MEKEIVPEYSSMTGRRHPLSRGVTGQFFRQLVSFRLRLLPSSLGRCQHLDRQVETQKTSQMKQHQINQLFYE